MDHQCRWAEDREAGLSSSRPKEEEEEVVATAGEVEKEEVLGKKEDEEEEEEATQSEDGVAGDEDGVAGDEEDEVSGMTLITASSLPQRSAGSNVGLYLMQSDLNRATQVRGLSATGGKKQRPTLGL